MSPHKTSVVSFPFNNIGYVIVTFLSSFKNIGKRGIELITNQIIQTLIIGRFGEHV